MSNQFQMTKCQKFLIFGLLVLFVIWILTFGFSAHAQSKPQFLVSWQAEDYAPYWYAGKILAINSTPVSIGFELIDNGKIADLSKTIVRWYVNDKLILNEDNGLGIKSLKINIPDYNGQQTEIRIAVVGYGKTGFIDKLIEIPVAGPEAVINAPYPEGGIKTGASVLSLFPFFFNVKDLSNLAVNWSVSGQPLNNSTGNPFILNLNVGSETPANTTIAVSVSIKNKLKDLEFASQNMNLIIR